MEVYLAILSAVALTGIAGVVNGVRFSRSAVLTLFMPVIVVLILPAALRWHTGWDWESYDAMLAAAPTAALGSNSGDILFDSTRAGLIEIDRAGRPISRKRHFCADVCGMIRLCVEACDTEGEHQCREDQRALVPKRIRGLGWTINFARPSAYVWILIISAFVWGTVVLAQQAGASHEMVLILKLALAFGIVIFCHRAANASAPNK